jgi:hypothetical protein
MTVANAIDLIRIGWLPHAIPGKRAPATTRDMSKISLIQPPRIGGFPLIHCKQTLLDRAFRAWHVSCYHPCKTASLRSF